MKQRIQKLITLTVNGRAYELGVGTGRDDVPEGETLADTLRDRLGFTGLKVGCGQGACGACTVVMDNRAVTSCMMLTVDCDGKEITTIEGLADPVTGELHPLQKAFVEHCGYQCGFCTPGIIMSTYGLLLHNPNPTEEEVREALAGNYCRCGTHYSAVEAIMAYVAQTNSKEGE